MRKLKFLFLTLFFAISLIFPSAKVSAAGSFDYQLVSQSPYPSFLKPGQDTNVWIEIKNTGTQTWKNYGSNPIRLGSGSQYGSYNQQRDYSSEFAGSDWLSNNRPATITDSEVLPGWVTKIQFNITAPATPGVYKAYFTPVADGITWMRDIGIYWQITVGASSDTDTSASVLLGPSDVQNKFGPSVVKMICGDSNGVTGFGSGTLFQNYDQSGYMITTNLHVVKQESGDLPNCLIQLYKSSSDTSSYVLFKSYSYKFIDNSTDFAVVTPVLMTSRDFVYDSYFETMAYWYSYLTGYDLDFRLARAGSTSDLQKNSLDISTLNGNLVDVGDGVYVLGYPYSEGANLTMTSGVVTGFEQDQNVRYVVTNAKLNLGVSGGLAVDEYGRPIGIPSILETSTLGNRGYILYFADIYNKISK